MKFHGSIKASTLALCLLLNNAHTDEIINSSSTFVFKNPRLQAQKKQKLILDNGISVYLVSDPEVKQSGAAFSMKAGSWDDPKEYPGTAHFVEHLLFMGSHTYPDEGLFMDSVKKAGGHTNAYTATNRTVYGFSSENSHFEEIFSIFAHMFIDPLFNPDSIGREYKAVEQEYQLSLTNDTWRMVAVLKDIGNEEHPHNTFNCGNAETLATIPVEKAIEWYKTHYHPQKGSLVITSPLSIDEMNKMASRLFNQIKAPAQEVEPVSIASTTPLFNPETMPCKVHTPPYKQETQTMSVVWELPSSFKQLSPEGNNVAYIMFVGAMTRSHEGSISKLLKDANLITSIAPFIIKWSDTSHMLFVQFNLTDKGVANLETIESRLDCYLKTLLTESVPAHFMSELSTIWENETALIPRQSAFAFCMGAADQLISEDLESYPQSSLSLASFNEQEYRNFISSIQLEKGIQLYMINPEKTGVTMTEMERWYQVPYAVSGVTCSSNKATTTPISFTPFPESNPYISDNMEVIDGTGKESIPHDPTYLIDDNKGQLVYWKDDVFLLPKVAVNVLIESPKLDLSAKSDCYLQLFEAIANRLLSRINTQGNMAGLNVGVGTTSDGISLSLSGFEDKSLSFFREGIDILSSPVVSQEIFDAEKKVIVTSLLNAKFNPAYVQAIGHLNRITSSASHTNEAYLAALGNLHLEDYLIFVQEALLNSRMKMMVSGAIDEKKAHAFYECLSSHKAFNQGSSTSKALVIPKSHGLALTPASQPQKICIPFDQKGASAILMIQDTDFSFEKHAANCILNYSLQSEFFETLRTKQQTGYANFAYPFKTINDILGHNFCVHSTTHSSEELLARYELFLEEYVANLEDHISSTQFEEFKATLKSQLLIPHETLDSKNAELFRNVCDNQGDFTRREKLLAATETLSYEQFTAWVKQFLGRDNHKRLAILVNGACDAADFVYVEKAQDEICFQESIKADEPIAVE